MLTKMDSKELDHLIHKLDPQKMPRHIAIILDGNGRWATARGLSRSEGHRAGAGTVDNLLEFFLRLGIPAISLYAFSTENWKRPVSEVSAIWKLLNEFFEKRLEFCKERGIKIKVSGNISALPSSSREVVKRAVAETANGNAFTANFCVNYGSRAEILHSVNQILKNRMRLFRRGRIFAALKRVSEKELESGFYTAPLPDVDLLIRPGGEMRVSNFLLWQIAYAEIKVIETLWPDFSEQELVETLLWYQDRDRRFGGLNKTGDKDE